MSEKRKSKTYSKEVQDKIDRDLDDSIKRRKTKRPVKTSAPRSQRTEKPNKKVIADSKKDVDYVTLDIPRKAASQLFKAAGMSPDIKGTQLPCKISFKVK